MNQPMTVTRSRLRRLLPGVAILLVIALLACAAVVYLRNDDRVSLRAFFEDSSPLTPGNEVRMNGALVGTIRAIDLVDGRSRVTMDVDRSVLPLHGDATARIEPVSLLGERFVALSPGTPSAPVLSEMVIDVKHTGSAVDLDQLLNTLDDPTSTALAAMVTTLGEGLEGNGDTAAKALQGLAPTFQEVDGLTHLLDQHNELLEHFVVQVQRDLSEFSPPLDSLVDGATRTLRAAAANRQALNDTLVQAPATLSSARNTLARLGDTADNTTEVLREIRPLTDRLPDVSHELRDFSSAARPALASMPEVLNRLNRMLDEARPAVNALKPLAGDLSKDSDAVNTIGYQVMKHPRGQPSQLEDLMSAIADWGMSVSTYDGVSHIFRAQLDFEPTTMGLTGAGALPAVGGQPPFNPIQKDPRGQSGYSGTPGLPQVPALPPLDPETGPDKGNPPSYQGDKFDKSRGASGLTPSQEGNLFNGLLGGGK